MTTKSGKLTKNLGHLSVSFSHPAKNIINIELHHGTRKNVATLRTVRTLINNLIIGVTKGYRYKMRYVYAHFPINVNIDKNNETGLYEVEIRYVEPEREKLRQTMTEAYGYGVQELHRREDCATCDHAVGS